MYNPNVIQIPLIQVQETFMTPEKQRLDEAREQKIPWRKWGPYLSERQWGTVREDYSENGDAWDYFPHDHARSRAYKWGEDGIAGFSDDQQLLCWALASGTATTPSLRSGFSGSPTAKAITARM